MDEPILSPDGKFMWTGDDWIPAPPVQGSQQIQVKDSVITGDLVQNTTIHMTQQNDINNYMKTIVDSFSDSRDEEAFETYELAKKIDYDTAVSLFENEYASQIADARINALELFYVKELKNKAPNLYSSPEKYLSFAPKVELAKTKALDIINSKGDMSKVYTILGEIGIEYRGLKASEINNENMSKWAYRKLKSSHPDLALEINERYEAVIHEDRGSTIMIYAGLIGTIILGIIVLSL